MICGLNTGETMNNKSSANEESTTTEESIHSNHLVVDRSEQSILEEDDDIEGLLRSIDDSIPENSEDIISDQIQEIEFIDNSTPKIPVGNYTCFKVPSDEPNVEDDMIIIIEDDLLKDNDDEKKYHYKFLKDEGMKIRDLFKQILFNIPVYEIFQNL